MKKIVILAITLMSLGFQSFAQCDLLITPRRVVFDATKQREEVSLVNIGKDTATFSVSYVYRSMNEDGTFENLVKPKPGQLIVDPYVKVYPRVVTLAPGEPQVIVLQCRRQAGMAAGEYRSHLYLRSEPRNKIEEETKTDSASTGISIQLTPVYGITIPVILRIGSLKATSSLSNIQLKNEVKDHPNLQLTIARTGDISIFGDLIVDYVPSFGKSIEVGRINGIGVYTDINKRLINLRLNCPASQPINKGKLKIRYTNMENDLKPSIYSESELIIQ